MSNAVFLGEQRKNSKQIQKPIDIVILGGGTAGWMAANLMIKRWGNRANIRLVESPDVGIIGVGEGSMPSVRRFFQLIDVEEHQWMPRCQATYKLNISFKDTVVINGNSGSGKTSLLKMIAGIIEPTKGNIFINNVNKQEKQISSYNFYSAMLLELGL